MGIAKAINWIIPDIHDTMVIENSLANSDKGTGSDKVRMSIFVNVTGIFKTDDKVGLVKMIGTSFTATVKVPKPAFIVY